MPYALDEMRDLGRGAVLPGCLVRLCIGLEEAADLERDVAQAYGQAFGHAWRGQGVH